MSDHAHHHLQSAKTIIELYDGSAPFASFLKQYFRENKKFGSRDRKAVAQLCYSFFRTGHALDGIELSEQIRIALFMCESAPGLWQSLFTDEWAERWHLRVDEKWELVRSLYPTADPSRIFIWKDELGTLTDAGAFVSSHLIQPDLFLRIRPGRKDHVFSRLNESGIPYEPVADACIALPNATKTDEILVTDRDVVVQDYNSQRTGDFMRQALELTEGGKPLAIWDCCAASGGKSLLVHDLAPAAALTVSDIRPSILHNLNKRFAAAGLHKFKSFVADLTQQKTPGELYDLVICDAPCTGSGTWGRTPEQLVHFDADRIEHYAALQKKILLNVIPAVRKGGFLLYITCSVFAKENEENILFVSENASAELIRSELLEGYTRKADTLFAALFAIK